MESLIFCKTARIEDMVKVSFRNDQKRRRAAKTFRTLPAYSLLRAAPQRVWPQF